MIPLVSWNVANWCIVEVTTDDSRLTDVSPYSWWQNFRQLNSVKSKIKFILSVCAVPITLNCRGVEWVNCTTYQEIDHLKKYINGLPSYCYLPLHTVYSFHLFWSNWANLIGFSFIAQRKTVCERFPSSTAAVPFAHNLCELLLGR